MIEVEWIDKRGTKWRYEEDLRKEKEFETNKRDAEKGGNWTSEIKYNENGKEKDKIKKGT